MQNIFNNELESTNNPLLSPYGVPYALLNGQNERVEELNIRLTNRVFPDVELKPNFDPRPVSTKCSLFPILDSIKPTTLSMQPHLDYYPEINFNPGNSRGPINGYFNRLDIENDLRNQTRILDNCDSINNKYIPSLESDLYIVDLNSKKPLGGIHDQTHPMLFSPFVLKTTDSNIQQYGVGTSTFQNHTRTQLRCSN
jgi:hypothetical protein